MSDCCSLPGEPDNSHKNAPSRHKCPSNGQNYSKVAYATVLHHVKNSWKNNFGEQAYYFCDDPDCDVVYFGLNNCEITKAMVRTVVGVKETSDETLICYCFGVSKAVAKSDKAAYQFVLEQTKKSNCSCKTSNPSGRCCLKDFPQT